MFQKPVLGPGTDIKMRFFRPDGISWEKPVLDAERLNESYDQRLVLSQKLGRWTEVSATCVTFHDGQNFKRLEMDTVYTGVAQW